MLNSMRMPRLFDDHRHRYTYTVLMSVCMASVVTVAINLLDYGVTPAGLKLAWGSIVYHWPFAFAVNLVASNIFSPLLRALTVRLCARNKRRK